MDKNLIFTSHQLKKELGDSLLTIKKIDHYKEERRKTARLKNKLIKIHFRQCAWCGASSKIEAAHIVPLELGGKTTEENLILLCQKDHRRYDSGLMSIQKMMEIKALWDQKSNIDKQHYHFEEEEKVERNPITVKEDQCVNDLMQQVTTKSAKKHYRSAIRDIKAFLKKGNINRREATYLSIKIAELNRRRNSIHSLKDSHRLIYAINPQHVDTQYAATYEYEKMYINRLLGNHQTALSIVTDSLKNINKSSAPSLKELIPASVNKLNCELALANQNDKDQGKYFVEIISEFEKMSDAVKDYWGQGWRINCIAHKLQVLLKFDMDACSEQWQFLKSTYLNLDITNGWASSLVPSIALFEALTKLKNAQTDKDYEAALIMFARSFNARINPTQRLEGIRDAGFGIARCLEKLNRETPLRKQLVEIMNRTVDGTSYIWPYINHT